ncbi:transposase [Micromonospora harpali]|uniref:Transposase n=1 Tax=Micromonospora harpali TaxID=1490225 RepID=A0ABW1HHR9_9ACTN
MGARLRVWPQAVHRQCVVHVVRASLRYTNRKDWQKITPALREIYTPPTPSASLFMIGCSVHLRVGT